MMGERAFEVKTMSVVLDCDECGGEMKFTGFSRASLPPQYEHTCKGCGHGLFVVGKKYPHTKQVEK